MRIKILKVCLGCQEIQASWFEIIKFQHNIDCRHRKYILSIDLFSLQLIHFDGPATNYSLADRSIRSWQLADTVSMATENSQKITYSNYKHREHIISELTIVSAC